MLSLSRSAERPLAYGPIIRQDLLMIEMSEAMLEEVCSSGYNGTEWQILAAVMRSG